MSVRQGNRISEFLAEKQLPWNRAFDGRAVALDGATLPVINLADGMVITLLSPRRQELYRLKSKWEKDLAKDGLTPDAVEDLEEGPSQSDREEEILSSEQLPDEASLEKSEGPRQTALLPETPSDVYALASEPSRRDRSVANGSSIAFLAEYEGTALLMGGDAWSETLVESIRRILEERGLRQLALSGIIVAHGGSQSSLSAELLELVNCRNYFFSTNGAIFRHPDPRTVARILVNGKNAGGGTVLYFNYRSYQTEIWDDAGLQNEFDYKAVYPDGDEPGLRIRL